jgi:hypothetical protein
MVCITIMMQSMSPASSCASFAAFGVELALRPFDTQVSFSGSNFEGIFNLATSQAHPTSTRESASVDKGHSGE